MGENKKPASPSLRIHLCHARVYPNNLTLFYRWSCAPYVPVIYLLPAGSRSSHVGFDGGVLSIRKGQQLVLGNGALGS